MTSSPAILGGEPMFPEGPPNWPPAWPDVKAALDEAFSTGAWGQYHGPNVEALESELASYFGTSHALTCASGTFAVEIALRACGVGPGDDVLMSAYDYDANFLNIHALRAMPVLVDTISKTAQLDPVQLPVAKRALTKAVICSHLHGGLVDMPTVIERAWRHGILVIEDAAQCPGALLNGKRVGSCGDFGIVSFGGSKLLSAGRGGALLTSDSVLHQKAKLLLQRGIQQWAALSELQASVIRSQLRRLDEGNATRILNVKRLCGNVASFGLVPFAATSDSQSSAYYKLGFHFEEKAFGLSRDLFCKSIRAEGVAFDPGFSALHMGRSKSRFRAISDGIVRSESQFPIFDLPNATRLHKSCVVLHHPVLLESHEVIDRVAAAIERTYRNADAITRSFS